MRPPDASRFARGDRVRRLEKTLARLDTEVMKVIHRGQKNPSREAQEQAAFLKHHLAQICAELGAETIVRLQEEPNLAQESDEVLDALEVILEEENLSTIHRLMTAWRFLSRPQPRTH